jgi:hypothetical protein
MGMKFCHSESTQVENVWEQRAEVNIWVLEG